VLALSPSATALRLPLLRVRRRDTRARTATGGGADASASAAAAGRRSAVVALLALVVALDALAGGPPASVRHALAPEPAPTLATLLGGHDRPAGPRPTTPPTRLEAYLITSARDCSSNLGALDLLARDAIAPRIRLAAALVVEPRQHDDAPATRPDSAALRTVREAVTARGLAAPAVRALDPATALLLRRIGYRSTPFLVVLDSAGALRLAAPPPLSFDDYRHLARTLDVLADATR